MIEAWAAAIAAAILLGPLLPPPAPGERRHRRLAAVTPGARGIRQAV
jgi:hypothetical protein